MEIISVGITEYPGSEKMIEKGVITLSIANLTNESKETILNICHKHKHLFLDGYPHGQKTRRKLKKQGGITYTKWTGSPEIDIVYYLNESNDLVNIVSIIGNQQEAREKYTNKELGLFLQNWQQYVIDDILATLDY